MNALLECGLCFGLTEAVELALVVLLAPRGQRGALVLACLCVNAVTHPIACRLQSELGFLPTEGLVIAAEALLYTWCGALTPARALLLACVANAASACFSGGSAA